MEQLSVRPTPWRVKRRLSWMEGTLELRSLPLALCGKTVEAPWIACGGPALRNFFSSHCGHKRAACTLRVRLRRSFRLNGAAHPLKSRSAPTDPASPPQPSCETPVRGTHQRPRVPD